MFQTILSALDIDECLTNNGSCHDCQNTIGSYECDCLNGFRVLEDENGVDKICIGKV